MDSAVAALQDLVKEKASGYLVFCTVSSVLSAQDDANVRHAINEATLVTPDGMPLVWLGNRRSESKVERVYGPDFLRAVLDQVPNLRHFFYGGAPGSRRRWSRRSRRSIPGWTWPAPIRLRCWSPARWIPKPSRSINAARPDVVWVGLGHPKQELWMQTMRSHLHAPALAGVGAAFDFIGGTVKEAPEWMKRSGLQWLHRLASEPGRLWKRYLVGNARFLWLLATKGSTRRRGGP